MSEALDDLDWVARCLAHMLVLDAKLDRALAQPIVEDMCTRPRWRGMAPEAAAQALFDFDAGKTGS